MRFPRPQLNYANVIATIALFVALGGAAIAAGLPKNSVGARQLKNGAVTAAKLKRGAVTSGKIAPKAVTAGKLGANAVLPGNLGDGIITPDKLSDGAVIASKIKNGAVTTNKLDNESVTTNKLNASAVTSAKLDDGSVNANKLADGSVGLPKFAPGVLGQVQTTAGSGVTMRGAFTIGSTAAAAGDTTRETISLPFAFPLHFGPAVTVVGPEEAPGGNCPGIGAEGEVPTANPGKLCVYITKAVNLGGPVLLEPDHLTRFGTGLIAQAKEAGDYYAYGVWAATAP